MSFLTKVYRTPNIRFLRCYSSKRDPGIKLRQKALNLNELDETEFDDFETDFMNVHKTHREHVRELRAGLEQEKYHIVKRKYFKEKQLNFLTWHDKEQIRYLHSSDPQEWSIEKLSEGFPALPHIIKKIVKAKWTINPDRIIDHDKTVQKNWENFKTGHIPDLPKDLVDHLNKFTNRALNLKPFEAPQTKTVVNINIKPTQTEFSDIITSYNELKAKKYMGPNEEQTININTEKSMSNSDNLNTIKTRTRPVTLDQLQTKLERKLNKGKYLSEEEILLLKNFKKPPEVNLIEQTQSEFEDVIKNKFKINNGATLMKKKQQDFNHLIYPEKITIPKASLKKGCTYKLNDCYYDDDGSFLYRVPGMY